MITIIYTVCSADQCIILSCVTEQHSRGGGVAGESNGGGPVGAHPQSAAGRPGGCRGPLLCWGDSGPAHLQTRGLDPGRRAPNHHTETAGVYERQMGEDECCCFFDESIISSFNISLFLFLFSMLQ